MELESHPTVKAYRSRAADAPGAPETLDAAWLKDLAVEAGADDVGLVSIDAPGLEGERGHIQEVMPGARTLMSLAVRLTPGNVRCVDRSVSDNEFRLSMERCSGVGRRVALALAGRGVEAVSPSAGFPMDLSKWPGRMWPVSHKTVAVAAGMGALGLSRLLLHPRFGAYVVIDTVLIGRPVDSHDQPLDFNPCLDCKLCAAVCPTGAVSADGHFNFSGCMTHNYRDRMGGFQDWVENLAASKNALAYRARVSDSETVSMWQSLSYGICNKSSYCMAVCPAGEDNLGPYLEDRKGYKARVMRPLVDKVEDIYVIAGSDADKHAARRFKHKRVRHVHNGLRPNSGANFLFSLPLVFQREAADGLDAAYHFTFTGDRPCQSTVRISDKKVEVGEGLQGQADLAVIADSDTWVRCLTGQANMVWSIMRGKIKVKGPLKLMKAFASCFPS